MNRIFALTKRNIKEILREPISLVFLLALPLLMELLFYFVFHSMTSQFEIKYLAPAMIGFAHAFLALFTALLVSQDMESAFIMKLYTTPTRPHEFILGYVLALIPFGLVQGVLILLVGIIISPSFFHVSLLLVLLISLVSILMFTFLGVLFGSLCKTKAVGGIASIIICGQSVLSGMWFPLEGMSKGFINFMDALPFRNIGTIFTKVAGNDYSILKPVLILLLYSAVSAILGIVCFNKKSKQN